MNKLIVLKLLLLTFIFFINLISQVNDYVVLFLLYISIWLDNAVKNHKLHWLFLSQTVFFRFFAIMIFVHICISTCTTNLVYLRLVYLRIERLFICVLYWLLLLLYNWLWFLIVFNSFEISKFIKTTSWLVFIIHIAMYWTVSSHHFLFLITYYLFIL